MTLIKARSHETYCEYCHEDSDGYVKPLEKNCHAYIRFGMHGWVIELKAKGWNGKAPIRFCPMCGRRLITEWIAKSTARNRLMKYGEG